jgi:hypothetical protein
MKNKYRLKFLIILFLALCHVSPSLAFYKKKVLISPFKNPANWNKPYDPGKMIAEMIANELNHKNRVQLVSIKKNMMELMDNQGMHQDKYDIEPAIFESWKTSYPEIRSIQSSNNKMLSPMQKMNQMEQMVPPPWPIELGKASLKPSLTEIKGTIIKFAPAKNKDKSMDSHSMNPSKRDSAELWVQVEIVQNKTGRTIFKKIFKTSSSLGNQPFSMINIGLGSGAINLKSSSMDIALARSTDEITSYILDKIDSILLEGEIIAINEKSMKPIKNNENKMFSKKVPNNDEYEEVLINIGKVNGVRIGDLFEVHAMSLGMQDPYSGNDLGDIYVRTGVVQIMHAWEGFSKAVSLGGKNFKKGYIIRSIGALNGTKHSAGIGEGETPWWEFKTNYSAN